MLSNTAGTTIGTSPFSESLKRRRKGAASALNKPSVASYVDHLDVETLAFVKEGLEYGAAGTKSVDPMPMIQRLSLSLALTLNWGTRMGSRDDPLFHEITEVEEEISKVCCIAQDPCPILANPFLVQKYHRKLARLCAVPSSEPVQYWLQASQGDETAPRRVPDQVKQRSGRSHGEGNT